MTPPDVVFVLGGGGHRGAYEVGMLKALTEQGIHPDVILGTSIGAVNGALIARNPTTAGVALLERTWIDLDFADVFPGNLWSRARSALRQRTSLHGNDQLREWLESLLGEGNFDDLSVPFQCVAACIEDAAEHWFTSGSLIDAILASSAVPGLLPPVEIAGEHFVDGGVVNSIPISRARITTLRPTSIPDRSSLGSGSVYPLACASLTISENGRLPSKLLNRYERVPERMPSMR